MLNKIILAGGTGFIGKVLSEYYQLKAKEIIILTRTPAMAYDNIRFVIWDGKNEGTWIQHLENADLLVNLTGKNVNCRYTRKNREEILSSRLGPTALLGKVLRKLEHPPKVWINSASATIYRHAEDHSQDEVAGELGSDFSVEVCKAWEKTFLDQETPGTRKIILRIGLVLGKRDGVLPRLKKMVKWGLGGRQGNGRQYISWIHEQDLARGVDWVFEKGKDCEIYNFTAPQAIQNKKLMKLIRNIYRIPFGLPSPAWLLEIGALIIRTETELILKSRWVYPKKLLESGFVFHYPDARKALESLKS